MHYYFYTVLQSDTDDYMANGSYFPFSFRTDFRSPTTKYLSPFRADA